MPDPLGSIAAGRMPGRSRAARIARPRGFAAGVLAGIAAVLVARVVINEADIADRLVAPLVVADTAGPADAIVVMGAGVIAECAANHNGVWRVLAAVRLWRAGRAPILFFTGGSADGGCPVAVAMARLAREIGVPDSNIRVEVSSRTTRENGELSAMALRRLGAQRVLVVTDTLHMVRSAATFTSLGFEVERGSVPIYEGHVDNVDMLLAAARESLAVAYYRARGWLGPLDQPARERHEAGMPPAKTMLAHISNPNGPVVVLGASYAAGWDVKTVGDTRVVNRGVAGQQSFEMLARFDRDVVPERPRAVVLWGFINDVFRAPQDVDSAMARVQESYRRMIAVARLNGIEPILATEVTVRAPASWSELPASLIGTLLGRQSYQDRINSHVAAANRWLVELARSEGLLILDFQSTLAEAGARRRREFAQEDGSHISPAGYAALTAYALPILEQHLSSTSGP